jgi:hypothetical protein
MIKLVHNVETDQIIEVEMTEEEINEIEIERVKAEEKAQKAAETASAKAALLEKLGITEDEAKLLLS